MQSTPVNNQFASVYAQLFDHTDKVRDEVDYFYKQFEGNQRHAEFDSLLKCSHQVNEALETETEQRAKATDFAGLLAKMDAVTEQLQRLGDEKSQRNQAADDAIEREYERQTAEWNLLTAEIADKRRAVNDQVEAHLADVRQQYSQQAQRQGRMFK